ncbi:G-protein coupled receptor [Diplogelasinospora grovesii]|uniref:G-protein coupled receptor n=1 Tax=Diplogelasinospora grovesii TaxID=303347 RepID=A0AAN6S533_9PEZI|nr:G-protein coupled receptor [Diplogelasinospora grovesii]
MDASDPANAEHLDVFSIIERVCSVFSLLGCVFVIATFCMSKAFHKPINRLVFYASFGNLMTNVATLMARAYVNDIGSAGCQFQAFLVQMFMPADAFWTLAMAVNVYLTFYFKYDAQQLRKMELPYLLACYGLPFIIAIVFIFISTPDKGRMYGNATLWCWVANKWDIFRIATFYGPVWIVILITTFIYTRAGREIYKKHRQLKDFSYSHHEPEPLQAAMDDPFSSSKTTEVFVTTEVLGKNAIDLAPLGGSARRGSESVQAPAAAAAKSPNAAYSVTISSHRRQQNRESHGDVVLPIQSNVTIQPQAAAPRTPANPLRRRAAYEANNAAWSYTKCAILFFTAMLVTWIPSSANRVYSVVHPDEVSLPLEYMSAFVLPLQGFWNALIYIVTSWKACQMLWDDLVTVRRPKVQELAAASGAFQMMGNGRSRSSDKNYESESMTELANDTRPSSHENHSKERM